MADMRLAALLSWIADSHGQQLALCAELEDIADSLPDNVNRQKCIYAAKALGPLIGGVHHHEEAMVFPALEERLGTRFARVRDRLKFEHCEDACFAEELTDVLLRLGSGAAVNIEATGYMLRGFFEGLRRHIAFERELLLNDPDLRNSPPHALPGT